MAKHSGKCLNVAGADTGNNANVQQYPCVGADNERWWLTPDDPLHPTSYEIKAAHSGKCLDIAGGSLVNNGNAQQYDCIGVPNERWTVHSAGGGYFYIKNVNSGKCLTVAGASTSTHANVDQYTCVNADNQKWRWNYFVEKHVQLVVARNEDSKGINITDTQFVNNFNVARQLFAPYGVNLVYSSTTDKVVVQAAAHYLGTSGARECSLHGVSHTPSSCAETIAAEHFGKMTLIASLSGGGATSGDWNYVAIAGNGYNDRCPMPGDTLPDICGTANDNVAHVAHELGHFLGNVHTFSDDWLADTAPDFSGGSDSCDGRNVNPPAIGNNIMSYHVPCTPEISASQGAILKMAAYARYANGIR